MAKVKHIIHLSTKPFNINKIQATINQTKKGRFGL